MKTEPQKESIRYALRPDAQAFDEVRIKIIPRFKESELSGSEWRTHAEIEFYRKGKLILSDGVGNMETACGMVYAKYVTAIDNGNAYFAGDGVHCDQEGCSELAKYLYRIKQDYCAGPGKCEQKKESYSAAHRCFCEKHSHRGDQDLQDNDANYELITVL